MSQWITPIGSVGSREAGSIPHFSLKLASFLTEGRQLAGALFFAPGAGALSRTFHENRLVATVGGAYYPSVFSAMRGLSLPGESVVEILSGME